MTKPPLKNIVVRAANGLDVEVVVPAFFRGQRVDIGCVRSCPSIQEVIRVQIIDDPVVISGLRKEIEGAPAGECDYQSTLILSTISSSKGSGVVVVDKAKRPNGQAELPVKRFEAGGFRVIESGHILYMQALGNSLFSESPICWARIFDLNGFGK